MNLSQLATFREIMVSGSISQAARNLGRSQPAVSLSLKALEDSLGHPLFERRGRSLLPAPEAHYLLSEATGVLDRVAAVTRTMKTLRNAQSGLLNVASMPGPAALLFPRFISDVIARSPEIGVSLMTRSSTQLRELVRSQSLDFAFGDHEPGAPLEQTAETVIAGRCSLVMPADHPLAGAGVVSLADLSGAPFGMLQPDSALHKAVTRAFADVGAALTPRIRSQIVPPLIEFAAAGQCCAVVDPLSIAGEMRRGGQGARVVFREIAEPVWYEYALISPRFRAVSRLAVTVRDAWRDEVVAILDEVGAAPMVRDAAPHRQDGNERDPMNRPE